MLYSKKVLTGTISIQHSHSQLVVNQNVGMRRENYLAFSRLCSNKTSLPTVTDDAKKDVQETPHERTNLLPPAELTEVNRWDKLALVKFGGPKGQYRTFDDVPKFVRTGALNKPRARVRVFICISLMVTGMFAAFAAIWYGKKTTAQGVTLHGRVLERKLRHREEDQLARIAREEEEKKC